jgi:tRNA-modifying protein YgfZ
VCDFGEPAAERLAARDDDILADLTHLALIRATGPDAAAFLNGQLTNDVDSVDSALSQLSAWCSPKGRMLAFFRVALRNEEYLLQLPRSLRDDVIKRLRVYILRSKVKLENADDALVHIGVAGPRTPMLLENALGAVPTHINDVSVSGEFVIIRLHGTTSRFEIIGTPDPLAQLWDELKQRGVHPVGDGTWTWFDIMAGIPTVLPQTSDAFVPQMANLDLIDAVSFAKGCYTGQEIVARVHYRGRLKQRMYRAHGLSSDIPAPGDSVFSPDMPGQSTGTVVSAAESPEEGYDLLAVVHCESAAQRELHLHRPDGPRLTIEKLPYQVPV